MKGQAIFTKKDVILLWITSFIVSFLILFFYIIPAGRCPPDAAGCARRTIFGILLMFIIVWIITFLVLSFFYFLYRLLIKRRVDIDGGGPRIGRDVPKIHETPREVVPINDSIEKTTILLSICLLLIVFYHLLVNTEEGIGAVFVGLELALFITLPSFFIGILSSRKAAIVVGLGPTIAFCGQVLFVSRGDWYWFIPPLNLKFLGNLDYQ